MKICVITQQIGKIFTGPGLHAFNLVNCLVQDGHQVSVIAPEDQRPPGKLSYQFTGVAKPLFAASQARWLSLSWHFARALAGLQKSQAFDLVHFTDARESMFSNSAVPRVGNINDTYAAERHSLAYYRQYYADWLQRWLYYQFLHIVEKSILPRLDALLANSRYTAETILRNYPVSPAKMFVCYKSVNIEYWQENAAVFRVPHDPEQPQILFTGTNMQRKGLPSLIRAAPEIIREIPRTRFVVVGEDRMIPQFKQLCHKLGVQNNFSFLGWQPQSDLQRIYAQSDLFVMPSLTEALGVTFLEALAAGCVPIGSSTGGIPEIIRDGENGLLVPPERPPSSRRRGFAGFKRPFPGSQAGSQRPKISRAV